MLCISGSHSQPSSFGLGLGSQVLLVGVSGVDSNRGEQEPLALAQCVIGCTTSQEVSDHHHTSSCIPEEETSNDFETSNLLY